MISELKERVYSEVVVPAQEAIAEATGHIIDSGSFRSSVQSWVSVPTGSANVGDLRQTVAVEVKGLLNQGSTDSTASQTSNTATTPDGMVEAIRLAAEQ